MKSARRIFSGLLLLLLPTTVCLPQDDSSHGLPDDFWTRFEVGFDRFMKTLFDDFSPEDRARLADALNGRAVRIIRSDTTIQAGDTLHGSVLLDHATLTVAGVLDGDIAARGGTISMREGSRITGDVRMKESTILRDQNAIVLGTLEQSHSRWIDNDDDSWVSFRPLRRPMPWTSETWTTAPFFVRYNRVEGLFLGLGTTKKYYWDGEHDFSAFGSLGYGFISHRWRGNIGVTRQYAIPSYTDAWLLEAGIEAYSLNDTKDPWIIGQTENTAAAFFLRQDFRDYFQREGFTGHVAAYFRNDDLFAEGKLAFMADRYRSVADHASWALFGGDRSFRANPEIDAGRMRSVAATLGISSALAHSKIPEGWTAHATAEVSDPRALGGEFDFEKFVVEVRRYQPLGVHDRFNVRVRAGTAHGALPRQKTFALGGVGTIPAFGFAALPGDSAGANRMILMNAEYLLNGDVLHDLSFWPSWLFRHINLILLADAGFVRTVDPSVSMLSGFGGIRWNDFRSDVGVGVANISGSVRAALVWRTDQSEPARFIVRFSRPF
ncbi:MAG: BamA/TamA family outer membrane protein [Bacteroidetes bacterium]|nr:BamA/TamA family outer membrane protein [Bacteroidota bacterium]